MSFPLTLPGSVSQMQTANPTLSAVGSQVETSELEEPERRAFTLKDAERKLLDFIILRRHLVKRGH